MIPFCKTTLGEEEKKAVSDVIDSGWVAMGDKTREFEEKFAEYVGAKYAVFVDSGTAALFLSAKWIDRELLYQPLLPILIPSLTFTSTAEAFINAGYKIEFGDVSKNNFCLLGDRANSCPVHLTGNKAIGIALIFDSAHRIEKDDVKRSDALWCYSFYATKNMTTISGGMIALNDKITSEWLKKARDHGISKGTQERYQKGEWEYTIDFVGWRYKADDLRAAIGIEQLKKLPENTEKRNSIVSRYNALLGLQNTGNHLYPVLVDKRPDFVNNLMRKKGVQTSVHFIPLHTMPAYRHYPREELPNTEYLGERLVSLPLYPQMTDEEVNYVAQCVKDSGLLIHE